jgi:hypothetical protein
MSQSGAIVVPGDAPMAVDDKNARRDSNQFFNRDISAVTHAPRNGAIPREQLCYFTFIAGQADENNATVAVLAIDLDEIRCRIAANWSPVRPNINHQNFIRKFQVSRCGAIDPTGRLQRRCQRANGHWNIGHRSTSPCNSVTRHGSRKFRLPLGYRFNPVIRRMQFLTVAAGDVDKQVTLNADAIHRRTPNRQSCGESARRSGDQAGYDDSTR